MRTVDGSELRRRLEALGDDPRVVVSGNHATPHHLLSLVDEALESYRLFTLNGQAGLPERPGVRHETPFVGPGVRRSAALDYVPARLSLVPRLFASPYLPDVVLLHTTPPRDGRVSLGIEVNILPAAVEQARLRGGLVVAQVNPAMPWTFGDAELSVDLVDLAVEADAPLPSPLVRPPSDVASVIAERVAGLVPEGATLQLGIGAVPDATLAALRDRTGLRLWSEMFSDGVLGLEQAGALDPDEVLVSSFLFGSPELYAWVDRNPRVRMLRTEQTNDPGRIAGQRRMTSVNAALQVDLFAQANASWVGGSVHSGFGGQTDFIVGALHAPGGQAIVALPSWHPKADRSTVVPHLEGPATSFQHSWIVSEQGTAAIWPRPQHEQTAQIVRHVAHPSVREELERHASERGLLRG